MKFKVGDAARCVCGQGGCDINEVFIITAVISELSATNPVQYMVAGYGRYYEHDLIPVKLTKLEKLIYSVTS